MKKIISDATGKILKSKKAIEKTLGVKITNRGKEVFIEGGAVNEYEAGQVIDAINFGFSVPHALLIKKENLMFEILNIKDFTNRKDLERIRGRIIGTKGKTLATLSQLTDCLFEMKDNEVGIIGDPERIKSAQDAVISLIKGTKQSNVYKHLEKYRPEKIVDLGLKEK
jgi:ribosomal RNA assembly protein